MRVTKINKSQEDHRGHITDILSNEVIDAVTLIRTVAGAERGNHYHKATYQYVYILEGKMKMLTQMPDSGVVSQVLEPGDLALNVPMERHTMIALEDCIFLVFTRGPRGGKEYETDTYRLTEQLRENRT